MDVDWNRVLENALPKELDVVAEECLKEIGLRIPEMQVNIERLANRLKKMTDDDRFKALAALLGKGHDPEAFLEALEDAAEAFGLDMGVQGLVHLMKYYSYQNNTVVESMANSLALLKMNAPETGKRSKLYTAARYAGAACPVLLGTVFASVSAASGVVFAASSAGVAASALLVKRLLYPEYVDLRREFNDVVLKAVDAIKSSMMNGFGARLDKGKTRAVRALEASMKIIVSKTTERYDTINSGSLTGRIRDTGTPVFPPAHAGIGMHWSATDFGDKLPPISDARSNPIPAWRSSGPDPSSDHTASWSPPSNRYPPKLPPISNRSPIHTDSNPFKGALPPFSRPPHLKHEERFFAPAFGTGARRGGGDWSGPGAAGALALFVVAMAFVPSSL